MAVLLDRFGKPVKTSNLTKEDASCLIAGVRTHESGYPSFGLTPKKLSSLLRSADEGDMDAYLDLAEEMEEKEPQYLSVLGTRKRAVSQLEVSVEAAGSSAEEEKHADFVREFIARDTLSDELFDLMDAVGKGFSVSEIVWECSEKQWRPLKIQHVNPKWFALDNDMRTLLLKTQDGTVPLEPFKYIQCVMNAKSGLPLRGGLARVVSWYYMFKNFDVKSWVTFLEVYGQPLRVGKYGANATQKDKETLMRAVYNIGADTAACIPESMMIEFVTAQNSGSAELYQQFAQYVDLMISKIVLGQTTTTDAVSGGHAVSKEHNEVRRDIMRSDAKQLAAVLKRDLIIPMIDLNFGTQKNYPNIRIGNFDDEDLTALSDTLSKLVPLGLQVSASQVRSKIGLDAPKDENDVLKYAAPSFDPAFNQAKKSLNEAEKSDPDSVDEAVKEMEAEWERVLTPVIQPVERLLEECQSYDEAFQRLAEAYPDMDAAALTEYLAQALFRANLTGRLNHG